METLSLLTSLVLLILLAVVMFFADKTIKRLKNQLIEQRAKYIIDIGNLQKELDEEYKNNSRLHREGTSYCDIAWSLINILKEDKYAAIYNRKVYTSFNYSNNSKATVGVRSNNEVTRKSADMAIVYNKKSLSLKALTKLANNAMESASKGETVNLISLIYKDLVKVPK